MRIRWRKKEERGERRRSKSQRHRTQWWQWSGLHR